MRIEDALAGVSRLLIDTAPLVYAFERNPDYMLRMEHFFRLRKQQRIILVTTPITLAECLVHPIQRGMSGMVDTYRHWIVNAEDTEFWRIGAEEAELSARLRSQYNLRLADALQVATAILAGCQALLTNDDTFKRITEIRPIVLSDVEV